MTTQDEHDETSTLDSSHEVDSPTPSSHPMTEPEGQNGTPVPATKDSECGERDASTSTSTNDTSLPHDGALVSVDGEEKGRPTLPPGDEAPPSHGSVDPPFNHYHPDMDPAYRRVSDLLDATIPGDLDRELEEADLLSRCYSLPYSIVQIGAAFIAIRRNPEAKILAIWDAKNHLGMEFPKAKELINAVAEKIGVYQDKEGRQKKILPSEVYPAFASKVPHSHSSNYFTQAQNTPSLQQEVHVDSSSLRASPGLPSLDLAMKKAINEFLRTGAERVKVLRGLMKHLDQEDLITVIAEAVERADDEHLLQAVKMMGPEEIQSLNWAAGEEIAARMIDAEVPQDFPLRPLEPGSDLAGEPVEFSGNGNPLLEKDVELAMDVLDVGIEKHSGGYPFSDEGQLAASLERHYGWNSVYAGEVAIEAWRRFYAQT